MRHAELIEQSGADDEREQTHRERCGDNVPRGVRGGRTGEFDGSAMRRLLDEGEDLTAEAHLPSAEHDRRVLLVTSVRDERACRAETADVERVLFGTAEDHPLRHLQDRTRCGFVRLDNERWHGVAFQALHERFHRRPEAIDHDVIRNLARFARQPLFESFFEKRNHENRNDEKKEEHTDKLHGDDEKDHRHV